MGAWAVTALAPSCGAVVAIASDPAVAALGVEVWPDRQAGLGPLGGIRTALEGAGEHGYAGVLVLACDLPLVGPSLVRAVLAAAAEGEIVAPLGVTGPEPLCALYPVAALPAVEAALARGQRSPRRLLAELGFRPLELDRARGAAAVDHPFLNVNTPERHARAEAALGRRTETEARGNTSCTQARPPVI
jgi:molybdopterin-guanine dinucleotide biosynthesis protein A